MNEDIRIEFFNTADIRKWLQQGTNERGLSENIISKVRALSLVNNPYVKESDPLLVVVFVNNEVAAYDGAFPEQMASPDRKICWNSMLYVAPKYEGRGYGAVVIGSLLEQYEGELFDHAAAPASVENFKFLGQSVTYVTQYIFDDKCIRVDSIRGVLAKLRSFVEMILVHNNRCEQKKQFSKKSYQLEYVNYVDDELYQFIQTHSKPNVWLRTKDSFNWMLHYAFCVDAPLAYRIKTENLFLAEKPNYRTWAVVVRCEENLVGFYILRLSGGDMCIKYLYAQSDMLEMVYDSILEHILVISPKRVTTYSESLSTYLRGMHIYQRFSQLPVSFVYPPNFEHDENKELQAGDGDMFS